MTRLAAIARWPVKGLPPEPLDGFDLAAGAAMAGDRAWALVPARSGAEVADGAVDWAPRKNFLVCALTPALAALEADWEDHRVTLRASGGAAVQADLSAADDRARLAGWLGRHLANGQGPPYVLAEGRTPLHDRPEAAVSILSGASLAALDGAVGAPLDPRRFRGNLWLEGGAAWAEDDLAGRRFRIGGATFEGLAPIERCRAVDADPATGTRDTDLCRALHGLKGTPTFGLLARVVDGGRITPGDPLET